MDKVLIVNYFIGSFYNSVGKIKRWIDNITHNLLVDCDRKIVIYTDNIDAIDKLSNEYSVFKNLHFKYIDKKLDTYYLLCIKFHLIFDAFLKYNDCNYICFAQSNLQISKSIGIKDLIPNNQKIQLLIHSYYTFDEDSFYDLYDNNVNTCVDITNKYKNDWIYYQSGLSIYEPQIFLWLYNEINNRMLLDFYNNKRVKWHDETYLNYIINNVLKDKSIINSYKYNEKFYFINKKAEYYKQL